jgi:hypothetical protein
MKMTNKTEWDYKELQEDFEVMGFAMGLCAVRRKSDGKLGSVQFDHTPRRYYDFVEA